MDVAQFLRRYDVVGRVEVKQRHRDGDAGHGNAHPAREPVGGAFFLLDVFLRLAELFFGNDLRFSAGFDFFRHRSLTPVAV